MQNRNSYARALGLICPMALILVYCVPAVAMQTVPGQSAAVVSQDSQPPNTSQPETKPVVVTGTSSRTAQSSF